MSNVTFLLTYMQVYFYGGYRTRNIPFSSIGIIVYQLAFIALPLNRIKKRVTYLKNINTYCILKRD